MHLFYIDANPYLPLLAPSPLDCFASGYCSLLGCAVLHSPDGRVSNVMMTHGWYSRSPISSFLLSIYLLLHLFFPRDLLP